MRNFGIIALALATACAGEDGKDGLPGQNGQNGDPGENGQNGTPGENGENGTPGENGEHGENGQNGNDAVTPMDPSTPLSALVAMALVDDDGTGATNIADFVKARVQQYATNSMPVFVQFPLAAASTDSVRTIYGLHSNVVAKWLDPITWKEDQFAPRFGSNPDYTAYFGDGWNADWGAGGVVGSPPQFRGRGSSGWMWVNHEYISGTAPTSSAAPTVAGKVFARFLRYYGALSGSINGPMVQADIDAYLDRAKQQLGGSWIRVVQDPGTMEWSIDRSAANLRYDASTATQVKINGTKVFSGKDRSETGLDLPDNVASGILGNCSGGQTPWGTIFSGEENVQDFYGDLESVWDSTQKFIAGAGFDPGANIAPVLRASKSGEYGFHSNPNALHARDLYGYLVEIDPGVAAGEYYGKTTDGVGHQKIGHMGRAHWENATFAVDDQWKLTPGKPIVIYGGDDRRSGRIYKWVSAGNYTAGMKKTKIRGLLSAGKLYVGHFAGLDSKTGDTMLDGSSVASEPGRWIYLSTGSADVAPNAGALGTASKTVGQALTDLNWNRLGGFPDDDSVRQALFTASTKIGVMELNRPEDLEYNPLDASGSPTLYIAFTNHGRKTALDQDGRVWDPAMHATLSPTRPDTVGTIFSLVEDGEAGTAKTFRYSKVWQGTKGKGDFDAANPDNLMIDADGGLWFGTDGNWGTNGHADAVYYLDLEPAHQTTPTPTFGKAFRIAAMPSDAEVTGPSFSSDMRSIFLSVQHPGEAVASTWPQR